MEEKKIYYELLEWLWLITRLLEIDVIYVP